MKVLCLLAIIVALSASGSRCFGQNSEPWRDPSLLRYVNGHMIGDHKETHEFVEPEYGEVETIDWTDIYGIDTLHELHRLFGSSPGESDPGRSAMATKALLSLPLIGRDNGLQLFLRPPKDLYAGLLQKYAKGRFRNIPRIETLNGSIAIDTHVHTCYSHDSLADPTRIIMSAYNRGLSGIAITDHGTLAGAYEAGKALRRLVRSGRIPSTFFIIPGEEIGSKDGHIIGLFLKHEVPGDMSAAKTVDAIHEQGGIAIAAHPLLDHCLGKLANTLPFDAVESKNEAEVLHFSGANIVEKQHRSAFYASCTKPLIGSSDSHVPWSVGLCYTLLNCDPNPDSVRAALLSGNTVPVSDIPESTSSPLVANKKKSGAVSVFKTAMSLDAGLCRLTGASDADLAVWPNAGLRLQWSGKF